jgi:hypothetical protein
MSQEKLTPKDFQFSKTERRVLLKHLEKLYVVQLKQWQYHSLNSYHDENKTIKSQRDRYFRLRIKPIELVLHSLGSEFMSHVKLTSIRRTLEIAAQSNGTFQSERKTLDYLHRVKRKRNSKI